MFGQNKWPQGQCQGRSLLVWLWDVYQKEKPWAPLLIGPKYCFVVLQGPRQNQSWFLCNNQHSDIVGCK